MKQYKIIQAYKATNRIKELVDIPNDVAFTFYKLRKKLQPQWDFQVERETAIQQKYEFSIDGNNIVFKNPEDAKSCTKEMEELANMDIDLNIEKIPLQISDHPLLSVEEMETLEDFLEYR